jgi:hypothetical protein
MLCYQVTAQFTFHHHRPALVSAKIKKQNSKAFLVRSCLPFGHRLKISRLFKTEKETAQYVSYLHTVYKNRMVSNPATVSGGQFSLF